MLWLRVGMAGAAAGRRRGQRRSREDALRAQPVSPWPSDEWFCPSLPAGDRNKSSSAGKGFIS